MKNEQLLLRISEMPYEDLLKKVKNIRDARVDAVAVSKSKPARKTKPKKAAVDKLVDKLVDKMTADEKAKLIALLSEG